MTTKEWGKESLKGFITLCIAIIATLITVSMQTKNSNDAIDKEKLDKKLDKSDYIDGVKDINKKLDTKVDKDVFEMSQKNIDLFIKNQITIQNDIKDMLKENK